MRRFAAVLILALHALAQAGPMKASEAPDGDDVTWRGVGPGGGGWIETIAFDPLDPNLLYVGGDVGGFYFSSDGGHTYEIRNTGLHDYFIESIAVHPKDNHIIILGTESGIHRTTDQGKTWQWIREGFPPLQGHSFSAPISVVCFDPLRPNVVFAGVGCPRWDKNGAGAIYRSDDTGLTWGLISAGQLPSDAIVSDIKFKPGDSAALLAATSRGTFRSDDEGKTWKISSEGLPHLYAEEIAFAPSAPDVVCASLRTTARDGQPWNGGVYRSDDAGRTWRSANGEGMPMRVGKGADPLRGTPNFKDLAVDPMDANVVYAAARSWTAAGVWKTMDGGQHWQRTTLFQPKDRDKGAEETVAGVNMEYGWIDTRGPHIEALAVSSSAPVRVVCGTSAHVFLSEDGGKTWQQRYSRDLPDGRFTGTGLETTCLYTVVPDPVRRQRLYFCYGDVGLLISEDEGQTFWRSFAGMKSSLNCFKIVVDAQSPSTVWGTTGLWAANVGYVCRSDDGAKTWKPVGRPETGLPVGQTRQIAMDMTSPVGRRRLLVTSDANGVYETRDGGETWRCLTASLPAKAAKSPRGLILDPADPQHVILALAGAPADGGGVWETPDGGATWRRLNQDQALFWDITCLAADPRDLATLYAGARQHYDKALRRPYPGGLFKSGDGGKTWKMILDAFYVSDVAISPTSSQVIYVATMDQPYHDNPLGEGVLKSVDGGATWRRENTGLSHRNIRSVTISPHDPSALYAGSIGNSAFIGKDRSAAK